MALTDLQLLRLRVADKARNFTEQAIGDGTAKIFQLANFPASSVSVYLDGVLQTLTTHYAISGDDGRLTMVSAPPNAAVVLVVGSASVFSDTELNDVLDRQGSVRDAVLEVLQILMVDAAKRIRWGTNQGLTVDESMMAKNAQAAYELVKAAQLDEAFASGGTESWPVNQENW